MGMPSKTSKTQHKQKKKPLMEKKKPRFFKVLLGDFAKRLSVPPKFLKHIPSAARKRFTLQGPSGSKWRVGISKSTNGTFFSSGWHKFVTDHSLRESEFLVFQYEGDLHFTVLIFDASACDREDAFSVRPWRKPTQSKEEKKKSPPQKQTKGVSFTVEKEAVEHGLDIKLEEHETLETQLSLATKGGRRCTTSPTSVFNGGVKIEQPLAVLSNGKVETEQSEIPPNMNQLKPRCRKVYVSTRRPVTQEERFKAKEAANSFTSTFPCIIIRMAVSYVYRSFVRIPKRFAMDHLPRKRTNMILRDPTGKSWVVNYKPSVKNEFYGGWLAFARTNKLEEGDYCAFELVGRIEFRVHIFRVVDEASP